jgi:hypothetical protein
MTIFNSYVKLPEGTRVIFRYLVLRMEPLGAMGIHIPAPKKWGAK